MMATAILWAIKFIIVSFVGNVVVKLISIQKRPTLLWTVVGQKEIIKNMLSLILTR